VEQEQEIKNVAPEPEVTQSNEEDSDDDVIAPSGSVGSGKPGRQRSFLFSIRFSLPFFKADRPLCNCIVEMSFWPVTPHQCLCSKTHGMSCLSECSYCLLLWQTGKKAPVQRPSKLHVLV